MAATNPRWSVGDEIRKARKDAGLEQSDLAREVGVSRPTISNWENGKGEPTVSQFRCIAIATRAPWLLSGNDTLFPYSDGFATVCDSQLRLPFALPPATDGPDLTLVGPVADAGIAGGAGWGYSRTT